MATTQKLLSADDVADLAHVKRLTVLRWKPQTKQYVACRKRGDRVGGCGYRPEQNVCVTVMGSS